MLRTKRHLPRSLTFSVGVAAMILSSSPAQAQFDMGMGGMGMGMGFGFHQVPSPTGFLNQAALTAAGRPREGVPSPRPTQTIPTRISTTFAIQDLFHTTRRGGDGRPVTNRDRWPRRPPRPSRKPSGPSCSRAAPSFHCWGFSTPRSGSSGPAIPPRTASSRRSETTPIKPP